MLGQASLTVEVHRGQVELFEVAEDCPVCRNGPAQFIAAKLERLERRGARHEHRKNLVKLRSCETLVLHVDFRRVLEVRHGACKVTNQSCLV